MCKSYLSGQSFNLGQDYIPADYDSLTGARLKDGYFVPSQELESIAFPGGYPLYYTMGDNSALCPKCAQKARNDVNEEYREWAIGRMTDPEDYTDEYQPDRYDVIESVDINYEDAYMHCDCCSERIPSAYADPDDDGEDDDCTNDNEE